MESSHPSLSQLALFHKRQLPTWFLVASLTIIAPILELIGDIPPLITVGFSCGIFGILYAIWGRIEEGVLISLVVTSTFAANIPLASNDYLITFPGHLGPEIWLVQIPMVIAIFYRFSGGTIGIHRYFSFTEVFLTAFVIWSLITVLSAGVLRPDVSLYSTLLFSQALFCVFLFRSAIQRGVIGFQQTVITLFFTILCHCIFAVAQVIHGGSLGVTTLGEGLSIAIASIDFLSLRLTTGPHVAGFTGMSFILASLIIICLPFSLAALLSKNSVYRLFAGICVLIMSVVLRMTSSDAARGGILVAISSMIFLSIIFYRERLIQLSTRLANILFGILAVLLIIIQPSSIIETSSTSGSPSPGSQTEPPVSSVSPPAVDLPISTVPYFDLSNLGIRLRQYFAGLDLFSQYPIMGIGGANFKFYSSMYGLEQAFPLHNMYLSILVGTGIIGFILYIISLLSVFYYSIRVLKNINNDKLIIIALISGMIGYLAFGFWDHLQVTRMTSILPFWILCGSIVGYDIRIRVLD